jgi:hypothetical protein
VAHENRSSQDGKFASHCRSPTKLPSITRGKVRRARPSILHIEQRTTGRPVSQGRFTARRAGFSRQMHHCIPRSHATALGYPSVTPVQPIRHCVDKTAARGSEAGGSREIASKPAGATTSELASGLVSRGSCVRPIYPAGRNFVLSRKPHVRLLKAIR